MRIGKFLLTTTVLTGLGAAGLAVFAAVTARKIETALPPQGRFIEVDGARLHYLDEGSGPAIVMIHGLGGQMRNFTYSLVAQLKDRFRVVVVERPGSGYSIRPPGASATLSAQAATLAAFFRKLELEKPLLVGHSLGGAICLAIALNHPECASGLALISPATQPQYIVPDPFKGAAIAQPWLRTLVAWTLATPMGMLRGPETVEMLFGPEPAPGDFRTRGGGLLALRPWAFQTASTDLMAVNDDLPALVDRYPTLKLPVGVLFGDSDLILDPQFHGDSLIHQIEGVEVEAIEGGGHMIPLTQPERCAEFIGRVWDRTQANGARPLAANLA
jgi:pimeloyl-ACP methyl ester carboxylesterase